MSTFQPTVPAEQLPGFPADYAGHGRNYGADLYPDDVVGIEMGHCVGVVNGFYQMAVQGNRLHACFGGFLPWRTLESEPVPGIVPGMLVSLDADSLQERGTIALPFRPNGLALRADGSEAAMTHTHAQTVSIVDLHQGTVRCWKPDSTLDGHSYRSRYIAYTDDDHLLLNYYRFDFDPTARDSVAMKFDRNMRHVEGFEVAVFEQAWAMPLLHSPAHGGDFIVGSRAPQRLDSRTGRFTPLGPVMPEANYRNYCEGPGGTLFAVQDASFGQANLAWLDPVAGTGSTLSTGVGSVELAWDPVNGWLLCTNYDTRTLSIVQPLPGARSFEGARFANIVFDGHPSSLALRRTATHLDVFVAPKWIKRDGRHRDLLVRVRIPTQVRDVARLGDIDACTMQAFDMYDATVGAQQPCAVLDMPQSLARMRDDAHAALTLARERLPQASAALDALRQQAARAQDQDNAQAHAQADNRQRAEDDAAAEATDNAQLQARIAKTEYGVRWWSERIAQLSRVLGDAPATDDRASP